MLTVLFILLILGALGAIAYVVVPKLPLISSLEVKETPQERWKRIKRDIIIGRLAHRFKSASEAARKKIFTKELKKRITATASQMQKKLAEIESRSKSQTKENKISLLLKRGQEAIGEDLDEAEKNFLEVVRLDKKNLKAYEGLFEIYSQRRNVKAVEDIGKFFMKLNPGMIGQYAFGIAEIHLATDDANKARGYAEQALAENPENPKYLDFLIELAIMERDKREAVKYLSRLRKVNPENAKIEEFERRIAEFKM